MRLVYDAHSYEGGIEMEDAGRPAGGISWRMSNGVIQMTILGGSGPITSNTLADFTRDQLIDHIAGARLALDAFDAYWRDRDSEGTA